ncbi:MAG: hypothetical protein IH589_19950 [Anaerolineales bacterium]|nr:hypothetical protein [Anaerolineales bacterium]
MSRYELLVGEPWNFEGPDGQNRVLVDFVGFIPGPNLPNWADEYLLLKVVTPFQHNNELVELMVASPRHSGDTIYEIEKIGGHVGVARIRPNISIVSGRPFIPADVDYFLIGRLTPLQGSKAFD